MRRSVAAFVLPLVLATSVGSVTQPTLEWSHDTGGKIFASPVQADLDGDGRIETVVAASRAKRLVCLDGDGAVIWEYALVSGQTEGLHATPSIGDLDRDGDLEIIFVDIAGIVTCTDAAGRLLWERDIGDHVDYTAPVIADVDGRGDAEILLGSDSGALWCFDSLGKVVWRFDAGLEPVRCTPAVADVDGDGTVETFLTARNGSIYCIAANGKPMWQRALGKACSSTPAIGDLDGDGRLEVVAGEGFVGRWTRVEPGKIFCLDAATGEVRWTFDGGPVDQTQSFALADLDEDAKLEVIYGDQRGVLRCLDSAGKLRWSADVRGGVVQGPAAGDVDGDGQIEIVVGSRSGSVICLSSEGKEKWSFATRSGVLTTPALNDVDGDGETEIVFTSKDNAVYCVSVGGRHDGARMPWPCFGHDPRLTGRAGEPQTPAGRAMQSARASVARDLGARGQDLQIEKWQPLHAGRNIQGVRLTNSSPRARTLLLRGEIAGPGDARFTTSVWSRLKPGETRTQDLEFVLRAAGDYSCTIALSDAQTSEPVALQRMTLHFEPFAYDRKAAKAMQAECESFLRKSPAGLRARGHRALNEARMPVQQAEMATSRYADLRRAKQDAVIAAWAAALAKLRGVHARLRLAAATPVAGDPAFAASFETSLRKVFRDEPFVPEVQPALWLARGEEEAVQVVAVPLWRDLRNLTVQASDLSGSRGKIAADHIRVFTVDYIRTRAAEYEFPVYKVGWWPDPLWPNRSLDVPADRFAQPFWISISVPRNAAPGDYAGTVTLRADGAPEVTLPLSVHVSAAILSEERNFRVSIWFKTAELRQWYRTRELPWPLLKAYYDYMLEHRTSPLFGNPTPDTLRDFEYSVANGQNIIFVSAPSAPAPEQRESAARRLREQRELFLSKGWDDLAMFYSFDEARPEEYDQLRRENAFAHEIVPNWPRLETQPPILDLFGSVDVWCPLIESFDDEVIAERRAKGEDFWFYDVWGRPGVMLDFPATDHRLIFWMCWKYRVDGFLYYSPNRWGRNSDGDLRWPNREWDPDVGNFTGRNGCGQLLYPGAQGPIGSIRYELMRDGIEDWELLHLLDGLTARLEKTGTHRDLMAQCRAMLDIDARIIRDNRHFSDDPGLLLAERKELLGLIEKAQEALGERPASARAAGSAGGSQHLPG